MLEYWIWLAQTSDLPEKEKVALVKQSQSPEDIYFARRKSQTEDDLSDARKILEDCRRLEIQIVTFSDADYPFRLRHIPDPPMVLYYKGKLPDFENDPAIGIVGTRKASTYGLQTARRLGYQIGKCGAVVVTGGSEVPGVVSGASGKQAESREDKIKTAKARQKSRFIGIYLREITACIIPYGCEKRKCF